MDGVRRSEELSLPFQRRDYSLAERILRVAVFQLGALQGVFERFIKRLLDMYVQGTCRPKVFDPKKAESALELFKSLGATIELIDAKHGKIHMMILSSQELEKKLKALGAQWKRVRDPNGNNAFAIYPPLEPNEAWNDLEKSLLRLGWEKLEASYSDGEKESFIVTCQDVTAIKKEDLHQKLFLHSHANSVSFSSLKRLIGFCVGSKQTFCCYDSQGTWKSEGVPSEAAYYENIEVVYGRVSKQFGNENIWITGQCGGCYAAAYLKAKCHTEGINLLLENGYVDLKAKVNELPFPGIMKKIAHVLWEGLKSREGDYSQLETGFNIKELWKGLAKNKQGQVIILRNSNHLQIPLHVAQESVALAQTVNEKVTYIESQDSYFAHTESRKAVLECVFQR